MNVLSREKQLAVVSGLIEGGSIRSVERITGVHRDTIMRVLRRAGQTYASENPGPGRYSPPKVSELVSMVISGDPDERWISTSHVQRWNLSMRTSCRRFTRLSVSFSRNMDNLRAREPSAFLPTRHHDEAESSSSPRL